MRTAWRSWWVLAFLALAFAGWVTGCGRHHEGRGFPGQETSEETTPEDDLLPETSAPPAECAGKCVAVPQAPFNSKVHLVWIGASPTPPDCPPDAPLPGLFAEIVAADMAGEPQRTGARWVRECLISEAADPCDEGETCVPFAPEDYEHCISRELGGSCPADYYPQHFLAQEPGEPPSLPLTLCCTRRKHR